MEEESKSGEQVKTMMRWRCDLFWRCLRASYKIVRQDKREWASYAYRCDHDAGVEVTLSADLCSVKTVQDLTRVGRQSSEDLGARASHAHETDAGLGVCLGLAVKDEVGGIGLRLPS